MAKAIACLAGSVLCLGTCLPLFMHFKVLNPPLSLLWKALGTACALSLALMGALFGGGTRWMCVAALAFCVAADILLDINFLVGMGLFIGGHVCYTAWFMGRMPLGMAQLAAFAVLILFAGRLLMRWSGLMQGRMLPFAVYAVILCLMGACGISCLMEGSAAGFLAAAGAALFVISDTMVCKEVLMPVSRTFDWAAMAIYYGAQLCLGASCLLL